MRQFDVCIVGGGSSGIGAAYGFARSGKKVLLIEKEHLLGGTPVYANVNRWEKGPDAPFCETLYDKLFAQGAATIEPSNGNADYFSTLFTTGGGVRFNRNVYASTIEEDCKALGIEVWNDTAFIDAKIQGNMIESIHVKKGSEIETILASIFIDASTGARLCMAKSSKLLDKPFQEGYFVGTDASSLFGEPAAPPAKSNIMNSPDFCFEIRPGNHKPCAPVADNPWGFAYAEPKTDSRFIVNPCGMLGISGSDIYNCKTEAQIEAKYRSIALNAVNYFEQFRGYKDNIAFKHYEVSKLPKWIGVRENIRVSCLTMLNQMHLETDVFASSSLGDSIAIASHPVDIHGNCPVTPVHTKTYGVPYGTIVPVGCSNLFVVSMSAGFSHIAASSVRLTRTLMQLGYAAAKASILALNRGGVIDVSMVNIDQLQKDIQLAELKRKLNIDKTCLY